MLPLRPDDTRGDADCHHLIGQVAGAHGARADGAPRAHAPL